MPTQLTDQELDRLALAYYRHEHMDCPRCGGDDFRVLDYPSYGVYRVPLDIFCENEACGAEGRHSPPRDRSLPPWNEAQIAAIDVAYRDGDDPTCPIDGAFLHDNDVDLWCWYCGRDNYKLPEED